MSFKTSALIIAVLGAGTAFGWHLRGMNADIASGSGAEPRALAIPTHASAHAVSAIDIDQVREVVREELTAARANGDGRPAPTSAAMTPITPELIARRRAAVDEVESMIRSGEWGNEQRATFHQHMATLDPEQAQRLLREVTIAFNQGTMRVATDGPPL